MILLLFRLVDDGNDLIDNGRVRELRKHLTSVTSLLTAQCRLKTYRRRVAKLILLTGQNLPQDTAHDLTTTGLWEIGHNVYGLGGGERANTPANLQNKFLS